MTNKKEPAPPSTRMVAYLRVHQLKAPRSFTNAQRMISYLERAKEGTDDIQHFENRVAQVRGIQAERLGKRIQHDDSKRLGTVLDLIFGYTGHEGYVVKWDNDDINSTVTLRHAIMTAE